MNAKKKKIITISCVAIAVLIGIIWMFCNIGIEKIDNSISKNEIIPEEEISDRQLRETMVSLYFVNKDNELFCEYREIDSKELLENPYLTTMNLLLKGPDSNNLKTMIPEGVKVNSINREGDCLKIDFSKEFVDNQSNDVLVHGLVINQIVNTLTQFSEINKVKISVEGKSNVTFRDGNINFEQIFTMDN